MKEIYKFTNNLSPPIMDHMFQFRENSIAGKFYDKKLPKWV